MSALANESESEITSWLQSRLQAVEVLMLDSVSQSGALVLDELIDYHFSGAGARMRSRLSLLSGQALGLPDTTCVALAASCELIHNASLLHDDIQDGDPERRGQPSAWTAFDVNTAMCAGTLLLSASYRVLASVPLDSTVLLTHTHQRTSDLIVGQVRDLQACHQYSNVQTYVEIAKAKSGSLLALPLELPLLAANEPASLPFATNAGQAFAVSYQILDDIKDHQNDLKAGRHNIVSILMKEGNDRVGAIEQARLLAQTHLTIALTNARYLPSGSGQVLVEMCQLLQRNAPASPVQEKVVA